MKALLNRRTIIILSTAVLLAVVSIVSVNVFNSSGPVTGVANAITAPVRALATSVARTFSRFYSAMYEYDQLVARNAELTLRIAEMEIDLRESQEIAEENERLRALFDFSSRNSGYDYEPALVRGSGGDNWSSTFTINIGYANSSGGIAKGMGVTTQFGYLVGQVYDVGATSSTVITILDTRFSASAFVGNTAGDDSARASVARGDFSQMGNGLLVLDQIDDNITVLPGESVVTSGLGGVFPRALILGTVRQVERHESGIGRYAIIEPIVNFDTLNDVFVMTGFSPVSDRLDPADEGAGDGSGLTEGGSDLPPDEQPLPNVEVVLPDNDFLMPEDYN